MVAFVDKHSSSEIRRILLDLRKDLDSEHRVYNIYSKISSCNKNSSGSASTASYVGLQRNVLRTIERIKETCQYIIFREARENNFESVDLHHLQLDESMDVLRIIIDLLTKRLESSGRSYCNLDIITGKGLHSKHRAVLYPEVQRLLREEGYKVSGGDGKIRLTVQI